MYERHVAMKKSLYALLVVLTLGVFWAPMNAQAAEGGTVDIVGHTADGFYLEFEPMATVELPRIFLMEDASGSLTVKAYASTAAALRSGDFQLVLEEGPVKTAAQLETAIESHKHLHAQLQPAAGSVILDFSISRHLLFGLLAMLIVAVIGISLANKYKRGVGRDEAPRGVFQNAFEALIIYIRDEIAKPTLGDKHEKFLPYLLTAFFFILFANLLGLVPYGAAATSNLAVTGMLAVFTFVIGQVYASKDHWRHILLGPPEVPVLIRIILVPVEILGLLTRHFALAIRLFANMAAGALVIFSLLGLIFIMNVTFGPTAAYGAAIPSIFLTVFISLVKLLVAFIQAYVFTILSALFIGMSVEEHDHHDEHHEHEHHHDTGDLTPALAGDGAAPEKTRVSTEREAVAS
ncbi:ATP synthase F0 subunit A [Longibacter salinarum]|uniref:ATP synthase subunit a n=2 Tax=Longibacter salinarum TaxID=1850348 RepID=A0A2A8CYT3_9BACT|nr:ATP synthase F0 subunit A [Longibacter salinarum]